MKCFYPKPCWKSSFRQTVPEKFWGEHVDDCHEFPNGVDIDIFGFPMHNLITPLTSITDMFADIKLEEHEIHINVEEEEDEEKEDEGDPMEPSENDEETDEVDAEVLLEQLRIGNDVEEEEESEEDDEDTDIDVTEDEENDMTEDEENADDSDEIV